MVVAEVVVVCGRMGGLPNENGGGGVQGGVWWWKSSCGGPDVRARGRMSGPGRMSGARAGCPGCPSQQEHVAKGGFRGKDSVDFSDEIWGKVEEKLDPHVAQQIHGTNSTKSCQINRSQKIFGALFVGQFSKLGRTRQKQARKQSVGLQNREKPLL